MEALERFVKGRVYVRREVHDRFGGQRQGGISTPKNHPLIFLFTGAGGRAYGYADEPGDGGVFHYVGEGQVGAMSFTGGNRAIRDHARNEKELHLFETVRTGVRYIDEMVCAGFETVEIPDKTGAMRHGIRFQLVPAAGVEEERTEEADAREDEADDMSLEELAAAADADPTEASDPRIALRKTYARSRALKRYVRRRAAGQCEGCGRDAPFLTAEGSPYLEAHHTLRRSDSGPGDRDTVIALCPNCHSRVHYGRDGAEYNESLKAKLTQIA